MDPRTTRWRRMPRPSMPRGPASSPSPTSSCRATVRRSRRARAPPDSMARTIVFIHGAWVTPRCWDPFKGYFEALGFDCLAPAWPGKDRPIEAIRADPSPLAGLGIGEIANHYEHLVRALPEPPILIGH